MLGCAAPSSIKTEIWHIIVISPADSRLILIRVIRSAPVQLCKVWRLWNFRNHQMGHWCKCLLLVLGMLHGILTRSIEYSFLHNFFGQECFFSILYGPSSHLEWWLQICQLYILLQNCHFCLNSLHRLCLATVCLMTAVCRAAAAQHHATATVHAITDGRIQVFLDNLTFFKVTQQQQEPGPVLA